jgi:hypothetical protein
MDSLPQELIDKILGYLPRNQKLLKNCSLVARSWRHTSQKDLFQSVRTRDLKKWPNNAPEISQFLGEIRNLTIESDSVALSPREIERFSPFKSTLSCIALKKCSISINSLFSLIDFFPNLQSLRIDELSRASVCEPTTQIPRTLEKFSVDVGVMMRGCVFLYNGLWAQGLRFNEVNFEHVDRGQDLGFLTLAVHGVGAFGASAKRLRLPLFPRPECRCNTLYYYCGNPWSWCSHRS